ncbi:MAG TPA: glycosyltransferase [Gaiellaceae bacterium]|nr:glycosyltransferase [Gaiellaceae bacterium]
MAPLQQARQGQPLLVSVGRLHRVKGLSLLLEAWAGDDELFETLNLVIVGGGLEQPTAEESLVLRQFDEVGSRVARAGHGSS